MDSGERVKALSVLIQMDQQVIASFHATGCPYDMQQLAKEAFDRIQRYRAQLEMLAAGIATD